ncbi:MFS transporter [Streptomyces physcomitrii]|uniref:MFS transporter n=1 Tax=Streptomyces physcomitrii TaxID=2724184 RepID=A0ABX1H707_9ACTN|nr:MFS transporter [Streptomyces physcomitrii]NKI43024.1 MFS transporter [Streptomyces physcomitrii]
MGRARLLAVLAMVAVAGFLTTLDNTVINVALPTVQRELGLSVTDLEWVATSYVLSFGALLLLGGRLADLLGRRRALAAGLTVFTLSSAAAALAGSGAQLIAARAVQGAGAALVIPASLAVVAADLPAARRATAIGLWTSALALALASGPAVGGLLTQHGDWTWVFLLNVPFGVLALLLVPAVPPRERRAPSPRGRLDLPGTLLSSLALLLLTYGLVEGGEHGFRAAPVPLCLGLAAALTLAFGYAESRAAAPLVTPGLLRDRALSGGAVAQILWGIGVNGVFFFTALYLQRVLGFTPTGAGLAFLPLALALLLATPFAERAAAALGAHVSMALGLAAVAAGLLLVSTAGLGASYADLQPGLLLIGAGSALTTPMTVRAVAQVPASDTGTASGLLSAAREISGVLGVVLVGAVLARRERAALGAGTHPDRAFLDGYHAGLRIAALCVLLGAVVTWFAFRRRGRHRRPARRVLAGARPSVPYKSGGPNTRPTSRR